MSIQNIRAAKGTTTLLLALASCFATFLPILIAPEYMAFFLTFMLVLPALGLLLGIVSIFYFVKSRRAVRELVNSGYDRPVGGWMAWIGLFAALMGILFSGLFIYGGIQWSMESRQPDNPPIGEIALYYYGDQDVDEMGYPTVFLPDSTLLISGYRKVGETSSSIRALLFKMNLSGEILWEQELDYTKMIKCMTCLSDERVVLAYELMQNSDKSIISSDIVIQWMSLEMDSIYAREYELGDEVYPRSISALDDGGFLLSVRNHADSTDTVGFLSLMRFDHTGEILWSERIDGAVSSSITLLSDSTLLFSPIETNTATNQTDTYFPKLLNFTLDGELLWEKTYSSFDSIESGFGKICENSIGMFYGLTEKTMSITILWKLDPDGSVLWTKEIAQGLGWPVGILPWTNSQYLIVGTRAMTANPLKTEAKRGDWWDTYEMMFIDSLGNQVYIFNGGTDYFSPFSATRISNGYYAFTGFGNRTEKQSIKENAKVKHDIGILLYREKND